MLSDRRNYPRVELNGEANLLISGIVRSGSLLKVCPTGVEIECRRQLVERLAEFKYDSGLYPDFDLEFELPRTQRNQGHKREVSALSPSQPRRLRSSCNVSFCRRLSQETYQLGLNFVALSESDERRLDAYISAQYGE